MGTQHDEETLFRLSCYSRKLPPVFPLPGAARHSSCAVARLTYWSVVLSSCDGSPAGCEAWHGQALQQRPLAFQVLVQGCTPGLQTVPCAELSALVWAAEWLQQSPGQEADLFTDSSYVVAVWKQVMDMGSGKLLRSNADLISALQPNPRLHVWKVQAHVAPHQQLGSTSKQIWQF